MTTIERAIEVGVPASVAYDQWTQFEEFPRFMQNVERVEQVDETTLRWTSSIGGKTERWTAKIDEQIPDKRIAWHSVSGARNAGVVTFHRLGDRRTRVMLQVGYEPAGIVERTGDLLGTVGRRVDRDLEHFKAFIEERGRATGAWRGAIPSKGDAAWRPGKSG